MSKKNRGNNKVAGNGSEVNNENANETATTDAKVAKLLGLNAVKAGEVITLLLTSDLSMLSAELKSGIVNDYKITEKTLNLVVPRLARVQKMLMTRKLKGAVKGNDELKAKVAEAVTAVANAMAANKDGSTAELVEVVVTKSGKKGASGKAIFTLSPSNTQVGMFWEFHNETVFSGALLEAVTA